MSTHKTVAAPPTRPNSGGGGSSAPGNQECGVDVGGLVSIVTWQKERPGRGTVFRSGAPDTVGDKWDVVLSRRRKKEENLQNVVDQRKIKNENSLVSLLLFFLIFTLR
jgi:hypothetical protein